MSDPIIDNSAGTITLNFDSNTNYTLSNSEITNAFGEGCVRLAEKNKFNFDDIEDGLEDWAGVETFEVNTDTNMAIDNQSAIHNPSGASDGDGNWFPPNFGIAASGWRGAAFYFYDNNTQSGNNQWSFQLQTQAKKPWAQYGRIGLFVDTNDATDPSRYIIRSDTIKVATANRSAGWHRCILSTYMMSQLWADFYKHRASIDGADNYSPDYEDPPDGTLGYVWRQFLNIYADLSGSQQIYLDNLHIFRNSVVLFFEGTAIIDCQPNTNVASFNSVAFDADNTGAWSGTITYEFAYSSNGGSSFGDYQTLNDANLQALFPVGNGRDILRIKITLTPKTVADIVGYTPRVNQIQIAFSVKGKQSSFAPNLIRFGNEDTSIIRGLH